MSTDLHPVNLLNAAGAPAFVEADAQKLLEAAIAKFEAETGRQLSPSQVEMYLLETVAYMLAVRGAEEQLGFENNLVAYARPEWLDIHGAERNTPRLEASPATATLLFETSGPAAASITIPAGTRVSNATGQVQFLTLSAALIATGAASSEVAAEATAPGIYANGFPAGAISVLVDTIPGIATVRNLAETGGGADTEGDARFRARLALAHERLGTGLSQERYVADVLSWNARCIDVAVIRPQPGYVNIYPLMDTGTPNAAELASLMSVFDESNIHQGDFIQAFAPDAHAFTFQLELKLSGPDAAGPAEAAVQAVVGGWAQRLGGYIAPSELTRAARSVEGVLEASIPDLAFAPVAANAWRQCSGFSVQVQVI
ncbi:baseplate J/gp47 family protein [Roseobacteraceae bacterium NS-SX3]